MMGPPRPFRRLVLRALIGLAYPDPDRARPISSNSDNSQTEAAKLLNALAVLA